VAYLYKYDSDAVINLAKPVFFFDFKLLVYHVSHGVKMAYYNNEIKAAL
jgi:hypothetical protein